MVGELVPRAPYCIKDTRTTPAQQEGSTTRNIAHASTGITTLAKLIDRTSQHQFGKSVVLLEGVITRALEALQKGEGTSFDRGTATYRDMVLQVPGLEDVLMESGFQISQDSKTITLQASSNPRTLYNLLAQLKNAEQLRKIRIASTVTDDMIAGCLRRSEDVADEGFRESARHKGTALELDHPEPERVDVCVHTLMVILRNILKSPENPRYRSLRVDNDRFKAEVVPVKGGVEILNSVGFVLNPSKTHMVLPPTVCLYKIRAALAALDQRDVLSVYTKNARLAEQQGLMMQQTDEELMYEMLDMAVPPPIGQEGYRNFRVYQNLGVGASLVDNDMNSSSSPTLSEVQQVLGIDAAQAGSVDARMELRRKKAQLVRAYESALSL